MGESQIGFSREARTSDHIFVVNTLINKVVRFQSKQLFTAFIDFRKAFDKVDRKFLLLKLWSYDIEGPLLDIIKLMYDNVQQRVRINDLLIEPILSNVGLKQGCNLSPTLFNLFIEDLKLEFGPQCDPVRVGNYAVSHLLYADDLILLSQSAEGLQLTLDKLHSYCLRWNLQINVKKSKAMVFNKTGKIPQNVSFHIGDSELPMVNRFKYLGTILSSSGSQIPAAKSLCEKTNKAYFALRTVLQKFNYEPSLSLKIFDTALKPILKYNCEIWAQLSKDDL